MAHLRPRYRKGEGGKKILSGYAAEFYDPARHPVRKYVSLRTKDKTAALQKLTQLDREYAMGLFTPGSMLRLKMGSWSLRPSRGL